MSIEIDDDGTLVEKKKTIPKNNRRANGTFKKGVSGNAAGRPSGAKSKLNTNKLINFLNKQGIASLDKLVAIADRLINKGEDVQASRILMFTAEKALMQMNKQMAEEFKVLRESMKDDIGDEEEYSDAVFVLGKHTA
jgi:hypothetical protein